MIDLQCLLWTQGQTAIASLSICTLLPPACGMQYVFPVKGVFAYERWAITPLWFAYLILLALLLVSTAGIQKMVSYHTLDGRKETVGNKCRSKQRISLIPDCFFCRNSCNRLHLTSYCVCISAKYFSLEMHDALER